MAKFYRSEKGIGYLKINYDELVEYSGDKFPICDECSKDLIGSKSIILLPILNEAYCFRCGKARVNKVVDYPEDRAIRFQREEFYKGFFKIKKEE